jgi:hypothetical protein
MGVGDNRPASGRRSMTSSGGKNRFRTLHRDKNLLAPHPVHRKGVEGWLDVLDATLFQLVSAAQHARGITGDVLEIGAYKGKSATVLGDCLGRGETLVVCDLFGSRSARQANVQENRTWYPGLERETFERNYLRFHDALPEIHQCASSELEARLSPGTFRLVHIDGSHLFAEVSRDIRLSRTIACHGGVVAFDDIHSTAALGIGAAVWHEVVSGTLKPRLATTMKLYGAWDGDGVVVLEGVLDRLRESCEVDMVGPVEVAGEPVWRVAPIHPWSGLHAFVRHVVPPVLYRSAARWKGRVHLALARWRARFVARRAR